MILKKTFYYGVFEYPVGSGNWYTGQHAPIITKELYDAVQQQLVRSEINKQNDREFAFTKLITCGLCGSGITACEKFKYQQNGNTHRYVYYGCTKAKDPECKVVGNQGRPCKATTLITQNPAQCGALARS